MATFFNSELLTWNKHNCLKCSGASLGLLCVTISITWKKHRELFGKKDQTGQFRFSCKLYMLRTHIGLSARKTNRS